MSRHIFPTEMSATLAESGSQGGGRSPTAKNKSIFPAYCARRDQNCSSFVWHMCVCVCVCVCVCACVADALRVCVCACVCMCVSSKVSGLLTSILDPLEGGPLPLVALCLLTVSRSVTMTTSPRTRAPVAIIAFCPDAVSACAPRDPSGHTKVCQGTCARHVNLEDVRSSHAFS